MSDSGQIRGPDAAPHDGQQPAMLVVAEDEALCALIVEPLEASRYHVDTAVSVETMLDRLNGRDYDIAILDVVLPGMDGVEALRQVKDRWSSLDVLIMTRYASMDLLVDLMRAGAAELLPKPVNTEHLLLMVEKTLYRRRLERTASERDHFAHLSRMDGLTGVYNHRFLQQILDAELPRANRYHHAMCLLMIDVDDFKHYNDVNGHPAGDKMLRQLADLLSDQTRAADFVARYGGEEFAVVLTETDKAGGTVFAERLVETVASQHFDSEQSQPNGQVTVSVGLACYPDDASSKANLIERADIALYSAKAKGKNRACIFGTPDVAIGVPTMAETSRSPR